MSTVNGHAAAIWLPQEINGVDVLTIAFNIGEKGEDVEDVISQPLESGLVSKAFKENETICHQGIFKHKEQSSEVDRELGQITAHQIAVPFKLFETSVGVMTVIQTLGAGVENPADWGFDDQDVRKFEASVLVTQRLFELNVIRSLV